VQTKSDVELGPVELGPVELGPVSDRAPAGKVALKWIDAPPIEGRTLLPPRRLYDRGTLIAQSKVFQSRLMEPLAQPEVANLRKGS